MSIQPVSGAKVLYSKKIFTFTEKGGGFSLQVPDTARQLVIQYDHVGSDTIALTDLQKEIKVVYPIYERIKDVVIRQKKFATEISLISVQKTERISSKELLKAACCNLSESFETTPSVDVAFTDAVTGYKQIQLLGLAGPYTLITRENIPEVRGLASITGLTFTPGQWIEGMQLSKGTGSVVNGYEGLAGQINIELRKPMEGDRQFYNIYQSGQGRSEANAYLAFEPGKRLYTNLFLHGKSQWLKVDQNHDHFIDQPMGESFIGANRWMWF
ncbi:MAG: TonB-dependent receptor, partial [Chitinophagaceae bacterium]|nr:TonB-dependent receptor [Chitinophagaceae bacterium]